MHIDLEFFKYLDCNSFFKKEYIIYRNIFRKGFDYSFFHECYFYFYLYSICFTGVPWKDSLYFPISH